MEQIGIYSLSLGQLDSTQLCLFGVVLSLVELPGIWCLFGIILSLGKKQKLVGFYCSGQPFVQTFLILLLSALTMM